MTPGARIRRGRWNIPLSGGPHRQKTFRRDKKAADQVRESAQRSGSAKLIAALCATLQREPNLPWSKAYLPPMAAPAIPLYTRSQGTGGDISYVTANTGIKSHVTAR